MFLFVCVTLWWHPWQQDFSMWQAASAMDVAQATTFLGFSRGLMVQGGPRTDRYKWSDMGSP